MFKSIKKTFSSGKRHIVMTLTALNFSFFKKKDVSREKTKTKQKTKKTPKKQNKICLSAAIVWPTYCHSIKMTTKMLHFVAIFFPAKKNLIETPMRHWDKYIKIYNYRFSLKHTERYWSYWGRDPELRTPTVRSVDHEPSQVSTPRIEPGPHWREARGLTSEPGGQLKTESYYTNKIYNVLRTSLRAGYSGPVDEGLIMVNIDVIWWKCWTKRIRKWNRITEPSIDTRAGKACSQIDLLAVQNEQRTNKQNKQKNPKTEHVKMGCLW